MEREVEHRVILEHREIGGEWEKTYSIVLSTSRLIDLVLALVGLDPNAFAAMPIAAQGRLLQNITDNHPPTAALN